MTAAATAARWQTSCSVLEACLAERFYMETTIVLSYIVVIVGTMQKKMETTRYYWGYIGAIFGLYWGYSRDNGKEHGDYRDYGGYIGAKGLGSGVYNGNYDNGLNRGYIGIMEKKSKPARR